MTLWLELSFGLFYRNVCSLVRLSHSIQTYSKRKASVHFRKWRQILFENSYAIFFQWSCLLVRLSHSQVEFGRQTWSHFRKSQRTAPCAYGIFLQRFKSLTASSHPYSWVRKGEGMSFQKSWTISKPIFSTFLPRNLPHWSFLTSYSNLLQSQDERPFQKLPTLRLVEFGCQTWSHFRKFQRTDLLCLWYFPPVTVAVGSKATYRYSMRSDSSLWRHPHILIA